MKMVIVRKKGLQLTLEGLHIDPAQTGMLVKKQLRGGRYNGQSS